MIEIAYHTDSDTFGIILNRVRAFDAPSSTLVNIAVFADQEIVANILPVFLIHMIILKTPDSRLTDSLSGTTVRCRMMNNDERWWIHREIYNWL